jgi:hypothetical protein
MRHFPHQNALMSNDHMAILQQPRRPIQTSASFTSLSSMETEYRRRLGLLLDVFLARRSMPGHLTVILNCCASSCQAEKGCGRAVEQGAAS